MVQSSKEAEREHDKVLFENANKNHTHQDTLRWSLAAGFGAFFYGGIRVVYEPAIAGRETVVHFLQMATTLLGTIYFLILLVEGWYYNLYLAYLVDCECLLQRGIPLDTMNGFNRSGVSSLHPSWVLVLLLVCIANTYHLFEFSSTETGIAWAYGVCAAYVAAFMALATWGRVPGFLDATLARTPN